MCLEPLDNLGTSNEFGAHGFAGKQQNETDIIDSGAPATSYEHLFDLLQLLQALPLRSAFVLLCFARLVLLS